MTSFDTQPVMPEPRPEPVRARPKANPAVRSAATSIVLGLAAVVAVGGLAFAVGRVTAPAPVAAANTGFGAGGTEAGGTGAGGTGTNRQGGFGGFGGGGGAGLRGAGGFGINGTVTAVATDHITIQLANGTTINIPIDSSTTYHQQQPASASDVQTGKKVLVQLSRQAGAAASPAAASGAPRIGTASDITVLAQ